jgi:nitroreductase
MARWAPSSCNRQLWQTLVIQDPEEKDFLKHTFPNTFYAKAPVVIVVVMKTGNYGLDERHFVYLDGGAFIQNLLLALHAKGYGACWVGFRAWDASGNVYFPRERYEEFHERFKLEKDQVPISLIAVGRPAVAPVPPPRQGLEQILIRQGTYREPRS